MSGMNYVRIEFINKICFNVATITYFLASSIEPSFPAFGRCSPRIIAVYMYVQMHNLFYNTIGL